jgi:hypothetical protein
MASTLSGFPISPTLQLQSAGICRIEAPIPSKRLLTRLEALRSALAGADRNEEDSFPLVFSDFLDLAAEPAMLKAGKPIKNPYIKNILEATARQLTGDDKTVVQALRLFRISDAAFVHGGFIVESFLGSFFFFENDQQGLIAFTQEGGMTYFSRITLTPLPDGAAPAPGPKGIQ